MIKDWKGAGSGTTVGLEIVLSIVLGLLGGRWLDGKLHTAPYLAIVGFFFGLAAASKAMWRTWREMQQATAREEREQGNPAPLFDTSDLDSDVLNRIDRTDAQSTNDANDANDTNDANESDSPSRKSPSPTRPDERN